MAGVVVVPYVEGVLLLLYEFVGVVVPVFVVVPLLLSDEVVGVVLYVLFVVVPVVGVEYELVVVCAWARPRLPRHKARTDN